MSLDNEIESEVKLFLFNETYEEQACLHWTYSEEYYKVTGLTEFDWVCDRASLQQLMQVRLFTFLSGIRQKFLHPAPTVIYSIHVNFSKNE